MGGYLRFECKDCEYFKEKVEGSFKGICLKWGRNVNGWDKECDWHRGEQYKKNKGDVSKKEEYYG